MLEVLDLIGCGSLSWALHECLFGFFAAVSLNLRHARLEWRRFPSLHQWEGA
jgi:hypothetical protein